MSAAPRNAKPLGGAKADTSLAAWLAATIARHVSTPLTYVSINLESLADDLTRLAAALPEHRRRFLDELGPERSRALLEEMDSKLGPELIATMREQLRDALEGARKMLQVSRWLSAVGAVETSAVSAVDVSVLLELMTNLAQHDLQERFRVTKDLQPALGLVTHRGLLARTCLHLFLAALSASDPGGREPELLALRTWAGDGQVLLEVRHGGSRGIEHARHHLDAARQILDTGLGTLEVDEEADRTVRMTVHLNALERAVGDAPGTVQGGRVLVIEDEDSIRAAIRLVLKGTAVVDADSAEAAKAILERDQAFDLVLCDLALPGMSGQDLYAWLEPRYPELAKRVIFVTGGAVTSGDCDFVAANRGRVLQKPFDAATIRHILHERLSASHR